MSKPATVYTLYDWEREVRDYLLDGLKVVKFILDEDTTTCACRNLDKIRPAAFGTSLERFTRENQHQMTDKELAVLMNQTQTLITRLKTFSERVDHIKAFIEARKE